MLPRRHLQLVAMILVAMSMVAFTPRLQHLPDFKAGYEANGVPLPQYLKLISDDQATTPLLSFRITTPSVRPIVRRYKLLPPRAESQDPL
jgi:hypothetical protein